MLTAADFVNNAGNEVNILNMFANNIIMILYNATSNTVGAHDMTVLTGWQNPAYDNGGRKNDGTVIPVCSVANRGGGAQTFSSYWCPYESNNCKHTYLENAASYMFTAKMDGCTFAVGSQLPNGAGVFVAHANLGGKGNEQHDLIASKIMFRNDTGKKMLHPSAYKFNSSDGWSTQATTFGILIGNRWKFFSQIVKVDINAKTIAQMGLVAVA